MTENGGKKSKAIPNLCSSFFVACLNWIFQILLVTQSPLQLVVGLPQHHLKFLHLENRAWFLKTHQHPADAEGGRNTHLIPSLSLLPLDGLKLLLIVGAHVTASAQLPPSIFHLVIELRRRITHSYTLESALNGYVRYFWEKIVFVFQWEIKLN